MYFVTRLAKTWHRPGAAVLISLHSHVLQLEAPASEEGLHGRAWWCVIISV